MKMAPANIIDKVATLHPNLEIPTARHALFGHSAEASESVNQLSIPAWPGNNPRTGEKIQKNNYNLRYVALQRPSPTSN